MNEVTPSPSVSDMPLPLDHDVPVSDDNVRTMMSYLPIDSMDYAALWQLIEARKDLAALREQVARMEAELAALMADNAKLAAQVEAMGKNDARYRWLRDNQRKGQPSNDIHAMHIACDLYGDEWDAAIDTARAGGEV